MKDRSWWLIGTLLILIIVGNAHAQDSIRMTTSEYPPYMVERMKDGGPYTRIVIEAFAAAGINIDVKFFPFKRAFTLSSQGKWDGTFSWYYSDERAKTNFYSDPVMEEKVVFFHLKSEAFDWQTLDDLQNTAIGATVGYTYTPEFYAAEKSGKIKIQWTSTDDQNLKMILRGRVKIFPLDLYSGYSLIHKTFPPEKASLFTHHPHPLRTSATHVLLSRKIPENKKRIERFNEGLKAIKASGRFDELAEELAVIK